MDQRPCLPDFEKEEEVSFVKKLRVLVIGPSTEGAKGGMATVINGMREDAALNSKADLTFYSSYIEAPFFKKACYCLWRLLKYIFLLPKYDVIHIHSTAFASAFRKALYVYLAKIAGKKVIIHLHTAQYVDYYLNLKPWKQRFLRRSLELSDLVLCLSDVLKRSCEASIGLTNCVVLNNSIDTDKYGRIHEENEKCPHQLLFLGKVVPEKGVYDLVEVLHRLKEEGRPVRCIIAGSGQTEKLGALVESYGIQELVQLPGWVDGDRKMELLKNCTALILPSYREGLPMSILEAMAAGKAIISTAIAAIPEVVEEGVNGWLFQPGDQEALYQILRDFLENEALCLEMGRKNYEKSRAQYSSAELLDELYHHYCRVAGTADRSEAHV